jgi:dihydropteroate synthase
VPKTGEVHSGGVLGGNKTPKESSSKILGILNLTPDSFSDGGQIIDPISALNRVMTLLADGADYVDIGAESTRPGAIEVSEDEEWARLRPALELIAHEGLITKISVDTRKYRLMRRAAEMNVSFINCVGPLPEQDELRSLFSIHQNLNFIASHMHGTPETMQRNALGPASARRRVAAFFECSKEELLAAGCQGERIFLDPGIGFGKTDSANWALLLQTPLYSRNYNLALGVSRKGFIGRALGGELPTDRDGASKLLEGGAMVAGAKLIRTHDVASLVKLASILVEAKA